VLLGLRDRVFRNGGKTLQMSDLHKCYDQEVGLANFCQVKGRKIHLESNHTTHEQPLKFSLGIRKTNIPPFLFEALITYLPFNFSTVKPALIQRHTTYSGS
jgi:hypothetical protein